MAQFKEGEYVTSKERPELGKGRITDEVDYNQYIVRFDDGDESLFEGSDLVAANACAKNAKFKVGDWVKIKHSGAKAYITKIEGDQVVAKVPGGYNNEKYYDLEMIEPTTSPLRSSNAAVQDALNSACARNAAPPKTIDLSAGNWEATLMPRTDYLLLEKGDIRTKDYTALEGTVEEVTRKVYSSVKGVMGKDLADAKAIVAKAKAEMVKYEKDERSHGRGTNSGVRSSNAAVYEALNGCAKNACAKNADKLSKRFGDVEVLAFEDGRLGIRYVITLGGFDEFVNAVSWDDAGKKCAAEARQMASLFEKRAASIKQAAAWLEANAK